MQDKVNRCFSTEGVVNPSDKFHAIASVAKEFFERMKKEYPKDYWALIYSRHWTSEGYWIENYKTDPNDFNTNTDFVIEEYDPTANGVIIF